MHQRHLRLVGEAFALRPPADLTSLRAQPRCRWAPELWGSGATIRPRRGHPVRVSRRWGDFCGKRQREAVGVARGRRKPHPPGRSGSAPANRDDRSPAAPTSAGQHSSWRARSMTPSPSMRRSRTWRCARPLSAWSMWLQTTCLWGAGRGNTGYLKGWSRGRPRAGLGAASRKPSPTTSRGRYIARSTGHAWHWAAGSP